VIFIDVCDDVSILGDELRIAAVLEVREELLRRSHLLDGDPQVFNPDPMGQALTNGHRLTS